jgi:hypothetical protein
MRRLGTRALQMRREDRCSAEGTHRLYPVIKMPWAKAVEVRNGEGGLIRGTRSDDICFEGKGGCLAFRHKVERPFLCGLLVLLFEKDIPREDNDDDIPTVYLACLLSTSRSRGEGRRKDHFFPNQVAISSHPPLRESRGS